MWGIPLLMLTFLLTSSPASANTATRSVDQPSVEAGAPIVSTVLLSSTEWLSPAPPTDAPQDEAEQSTTQPESTGITSDTFTTDLGVEFECTDGDKSGEGGSSTVDFSTSFSGSQLSAGDQITSSSNGIDRANTDTPSIDDKQVQTSAAAPTSRVSTSYIAVQLALAAGSTLLLLLTAH